MKNKPTLVNLEMCHLLAKKKQGACLSKRYINARTPMLWRCGEGHTWKAVYDKIRIGRWCRKCSMRQVGINKRHTISEMREVAKKRDGECLSSVYVTGDKKLKWKCKNNHIFYSVPYNILSGKWCRKCGYETVKTNSRDKKLYIAKKNLSKNNWKLISIDRELNRIEVECLKGHRRNVLIQNIAYKKLSCPTCNKKSAYDVEKLNMLVEQRGGRCLASVYKNAYEKIAWQCKFKHDFLSSTGNVKSGKWCPICGKMSKSIQATRLRAKNKGGNCISEIYEGPEYHKKIAIFECHRGHQWKMSVAEEKSGRWCPECLKLNLKGLHY